jgi:hypothetical protein
METIRTLDAAVARVASRQRSVITHAQAVGLGATQAMIHTRLATGRWIQIARGVYRIGGAPVSWHQRATAACLLAGPGAVVSHRSAAVVWGLSGFRPGRLEVTVPAGRSGRSPLALVHRSLQLPADDCTSCDLVPVTRPPRTVLDLAARVSPVLLEEAVDDVLCRRLTTLERLRGRAHQLGPRRGSEALRLILEAWAGDGVAANVAEMRVVRLLIDAGLPVPVRQYELWVDGELIARFDIAYPEDRLAIELDSFRWHAGRGPFRSDRVRANRVMAAGWRLLRATPEDAADGRNLVRATSQLLAVAA